MTGLTKKTLMTAMLTLSATLAAGAACAGDKDPPPSKDLICHNIGGPRDLGANCENTGNCTVETEEGFNIVFTDENQFLGIVIGAGPQSAAAHIAHGDGYVQTLFSPALHLASEIGPHRASNVECLATRVNPQPPEPGN
ncbi:hypothetical protein [Lysobacter niastensis]|uniref:Lipoprotein n=1 Tax=Lysobacter niastensis TaxID=380629 RepID=A0ABS0B6F2_9GAMM|nr:hypothetical protein [Lysobacter niastensis]MBF6022604.1 hypothetical protein [Lysobacter niastensis]